MNYDESIAWLYGTQWSGIKLGLETVHRLLGALGEPPQPAATIFHVAGTNGKGSTCAMLDALCREAGLCTALFTSPHLVTFRERIRLNGAMIPEGDLAAALTRIRDLIEGWEIPPTFFEITTALALAWFRAQNAEAIILETGLGGRLDSTNAITPTVAVLTPISFDHQQYLGDTLESIATEKAGIIKPGIPVVSAMQVLEAETVIETAARERNAPLEWVTTPLDLEVALPGSHQKSNAALALAAFHKAGLTLPEKSIRKALQNVVWPGRFQQIHGTPEIILDGAHNEAAATRLVQTWHEVYGTDKPVIVLGVLADKEVRLICQTLAPLAAEFRIVPVRNPRAIAPDDLAALLGEIAPEVPAHTAESLEAALEEALTQARGTHHKFPNRRILITGSLFLIGEALSSLDGLNTLPPPDPISAQ